MTLKDTDELIELIDDDIAAHKDGYFEDFELPPAVYGSLCALRMVREYIKALPTIEPQRAYEQGVKDTLDKYDENFRIASEVRIAVGCKTAKECWELARKGDIQRVKHGRWVKSKKSDYVWECSNCGYGFTDYRTTYCYDCGARMDEVEE